MPFELKQYKQRKKSPVNRARTHRFLLKKKNIFEFFWHYTPQCSCMTIVWVLVAHNQEKLLLQQSKNIQEHKACVRSHLLASFSLPF